MTKAPPRESRMTSRQISQQAGSRSMRAVISAALLRDMSRSHRSSGTLPFTARGVWIARKFPSGLLQGTLPAIQYSAGANRWPEGQGAFARYREIFGILGMK